MRRDLLLVFLLGTGLATGVAQKPIKSPGPNMPPVLPRRRRKKP